MKTTLQRIDKDNLKVGDIVGIPYEVSLGWSRFRYNKIVPMKVTRITPKRTKFVFNDSLELNERACMVEYDNEAKRQTMIADHATQINNFLYKIENMKRESKLFSLSDEKIEKIAALTRQIEEVMYDEQTIS